MFCGRRKGHQTDLCVFGVDYKLLGILKRQFSKVPLLGLTATATSSVLKDCEKILCVTQPITLTASFNRASLYYEVTMFTALAHLPFSHLLHTEIHTECLCVICYRHMLSVQLHTCHSISAPLHCSASTCITLKLQDAMIFDVFEPFAVSTCDWFFFSICWHLT